MKEFFKNRSIQAAFIAGFFLLLVTIITLLWPKDKVANIENNTASNTGPNSGVVVGKIEVNTSRHLDINSQASLKNSLAKYNGKNIAVSSTVGDGEAAQYALEIANYLNSQGWDVRDNVGNFLAPEYSLGLHIIEVSNQVMIYVGSRG
jgi:hypothetical protein